MDRPIRVPTGRLVLLCAVGAFLIGYGAYYIFQPAPSTPSKQSTQSIAATHSETPAAENSAAESAPENPRDLVEVSSKRIDFGTVPTHFSVHQSLLFLNRGAAPISVDGIRLEKPFATTQETLSLSPEARTLLEVTFRPERPGKYESHAVLNLGPPVNEVIELIVLGEAVLSPEDAGVVIPPPPDQELLEHEAATMTALAKSPLRQEALARGGADDGDSAEGSDDSAMESGPGASSGPGEGWPAAFQPGMLVAFGEEMSNPREDPNKSPSRFPARRKSLSFLRLTRGMTTVSLKATRRIRPIRRSLPTRRS